MSPDEILAANLWPWPDPLLKRDRNGHVLFVNAAFLQLYGGRAQDWHGQPVSGWPHPATQGAQRFETRAGEAGQENVFDWVEMVMADGNAMAIARNVTTLVTPPTPPAVEAPAPQPPITQAPPEPVTPPQAQAPVSAPVAPPIATPAAPVEQPVMAAPEQAPAPEPEPQAPDLGSEFEETLSRGADDYAYETAENPVPEPAPIPAPAPQPEPVKDNDGREYERRALPIEDSTSVLGSNWRDQVIAKAVGAEPPESETPQQNQAPEIEDGKAGAGLLILLAEDNAINALLTRTLLEAEGAEVDTVEDGALAVEAVKTKEYHLIFMDMRMPNMDGLEATRKIRASGYTKPIIALTANAFDDDRNACFDSGMNDFMTKPVSAEELIEMVTTWINKDKEQEKLAS